MRIPPRRLRTGLAAGALVAAAATGTAVAAPATTVRATVAVPVLSFAASLPGVGADPEASPPGVNVPCSPSAAHPYPVVLVNGTFTVMQDSFDYLGPTLANAGYCVYGYNYGGVRGSRVQAVGPVDDAVTALAAEVRTVLAGTGAARVDLVGYSQGGLVTELYTKFGGAPSVHSVTAIAPTTHGTTLLGIGTVGSQVPGALALLSAGGCPACSDQVRGSAVTTRLDAGQIHVTGIPYTVIDTVFEDVVTPTGSSFIREPGVTNQYVQDHATVDTDDHVTLPFDPVTGQLVLAALARA